MSELNELVKSLSGRKRAFILMRVSGLDPDVSRKLVNVTQGTYNSWLKNDVFVEIYHRVPELMEQYRNDAVRMLRKDNQLEAVLLEGKIIQKMKEEIEAGEYVLVKTHLAREVYSKLMTDLDITPDVKILSWEQRVAHFLPSQLDQLPQGGVYDGEFEEVGVVSTKHSQGQHVSEVQSPSDEAQETA